MARREQSSHEHFAAPPFFSRPLPEPSRGLGILIFIAGLPRVSAQEAAVNPGMVRFRPEMEPLVKLLRKHPASGCWRRWRPPSKKA